MKDKKEVTVRPEQSLAKRFMNRVISDFSTNISGDVALTTFQKRLSQNYFIAADAAIKKAEENRLKKSQKYRDQLPVTWSNINFDKLARDVVAFSRIGLDPAISNHVALIPYKNNAINKYDIGFIEGYRGLELEAHKYGLDVPDNVIVELVHETDEFKSYKKNMNNNKESYDFKVVNDFNRGAIIGGFYYHEYRNEPERNKLVVVPIKDILKRKPKYASPEFWGGEKDVWQNGKKTGKKDPVEGWYEEMCYKTICRMAYKAITIDSKKIDDAYMQMKQIEQEFVTGQTAEEIEEKANREIIDIAPEAEEVDTTASTDTQEAEPAQEDNKTNGY